MFIFSFIPLTLYSLRPHRSFVIVVSQEYIFSFFFSFIPLPFFLRKPPLLQEVYLSNLNMTSENSSRFLFISLLIYTDLNLQIQISISIFRILRLELFLFVYSPCSLGTIVTIMLAQQLMCFALTLCLSRSYVHVRIKYTLLSNLHRTCIIYADNMHNMRTRTFTCFLFIRPYVLAWLHDQKENRS